METFPQSEERHDDIPIPASLPPAEGRDDIGRENDLERYSPVGSGEPGVLSQPPVEGRVDIAEDIEQERQQAYSSAKDQEKKRQD
ncbi:hypothetical protein KSD_44690 [Ktedonobacter sp. SOSP1-85]|uniref:hypothetical protein n=1 Tax=Ktedonobacter sp. SOSP1-85 TaxID=2778367 RepID=UPI001915B5B9|nr:hypothetical protein [Ktedonobacter sp. SOSP1-85]GHO76698.1 hypothetical protein KSD_44690 [Ktedonobacter sp. SOSP1-85]